MRPKSKITNSIQQDRIDVHKSRKLDTIHGRINRVHQFKCLVEIIEPTAYRKRRTDTKVETSKDEMSPGKDEGHI